VGPFIDELADQLNLRWAWEKVRHQAAQSDYWYDEIELAGFELELERNLESIAAEFRSGDYRLAPLRPLPFPKDPDKQGNLRLRQVFEVRVRDQVAWAAVVNVVGPHVDSKMPSWSYGNRLYRTIWVDEDKDGVRRRKIGRYRHAAGRLYLPFGQSWPVFRRHVYLASRAMTVPYADRFENLDEATEEELNFQRYLNEEHRCPFVMPEYWRNRRPQKGELELFWCSIDLAKFYPTSRLSIVLENIVEQLPHEWREDANRLMGSMLRFRLDMSEWQDAGEANKIDLAANRKTFTRIPTGLFVAGFLANAALLKVDLQVVERLKDNGIAHFRFVDDHVMLAYSFDQLMKWLREYAGLLRDSGVGARVNTEKVEPEELARLMTRNKQKPSVDKHSALWKKAEAACELDPHFPSPLMTKTLALVSGIARTDFNLLESEELAALTDQLEHLLLVDLPHEEIPDKTRLSFAATRLALVAERRLAGFEPLAALRCREEALRSELERKELGKERREELEHALEAVAKELHEGDSRLEGEVSRIFELLRKVLQERPDRTRLWTRALLMCRSTGVKGVAALLSDISRHPKVDPPAREYLRANMLVLLSAQVLVAARTLTDAGVAHWRRKAARSYIEDVKAAEIQAPDKDKDRRFLRASWLQFCFGLYCADLVLKESGSSYDALPGISLPEAQLATGRNSSRHGTPAHPPAQWAWWAGRMTLRDLQAQADGLVKALGNDLAPSTEAAAFWRFFPLDVPTFMLGTLLEDKRFLVSPTTTAGWWFDALRKRPELIGSLSPQVQRRVPRPVRRILTSKTTDGASLYEWCDFLDRRSKEGSTDPRHGEWTALEIVRQAAILVGKEPTLDARYLRSASRSPAGRPCVHPANFRIPKEWLTSDEPTWDDWSRLVRKMNIAYLPKSDRIQDERYTPLGSQSLLFTEVNPVRGLGLLLYGLLRKSFDLPALWNGPGHADVLGMLPKLLLGQMACSSITLGLLAGCLEARVTETLFLKRRPLVGYDFQEDTLREPIAFITPQEVQNAVTVSQNVLEEHQLSTMNRRARQLTPVSIRQLTEPEWSKVFEPAEVGGGGVHE
jgi:hypothetical protein